MNTVILHASKSGAARECAGMLAERIENCTVFDLFKETPDISTADVIVIGSGVRMGRVYKPFRRFIQKNLEMMLSKTTAIYLCNGEPAAYKTAVEKNIPPELAAHSLSVMPLGGRRPFSSQETRDWILEDNLNAFAQALKRE